MNRYYFNFREGNDVVLDQVGMYLPSLDAARGVALQTCHDLVEVAAKDGTPADWAIQIADASGEPVLTIPCDDGLSGSGSTVRGSEQP